MVHGAVAAAAVPNQLRARMSAGAVNRIRGVLNRALLSRHQGGERWPGCEASLRVPGGDRHTREGSTGEALPGCCLEVCTGALVDRVVAERVVRHVVGGSRGAGALGESKPR